MSEPSRRPLGAVLAGGAGRRMGGRKATLPLLGEPLIARPLRAMRAVLDDVVVVAKDAHALGEPRELPGDLRDVPVLVEPGEPRHPAVGIVCALEHAGERGVLVCACDMPFVSAAVLARLVEARGVASVGGASPEPLLGFYGFDALDVLRRGAEEGAPMHALVATLGRLAIEVGREVAFNVNTPEDLACAEEILGQGGAK